jgi:DNA-directed RNA polymerase specialized sigma24 family protein
MFNSFGGDPDAEGGPGFSVSWRGGEADYEPWRFDVERPWALHETPVSGDRDGYATPDAPPEQAVWARKMIPIMLADLTPRQRFVMELHWDVGARANRRHTFEEIAGYMGVTKQAVHQIHGRALKKLHRRWAD